MKGLDEPNMIELAYKIPINQPSNNYINGFTNFQQSNVSLDADFYKFTSDRTGEAILDVYNLINSSYWQVAVYSDPNSSPIESTNNDLQPGYYGHLTFDVVQGSDYYIRISSEALPYSYYYPYKIRVSTNEVPYELFTKCKCLLC